MITRLISALQVDGKPPQGRKKCLVHYNNRLFLMT